MAKSSEREALLREKMVAPGRYECTVPGCKVRQRQDGLCPQHNVPLRLAKRKR